MAITAGITLTSAAGDLITDALTLSTTTNLTKAGTTTAIAQTSGLARTNFTVGGSAPFKSKIIYRSNDATTDGANKVYLKNLSETAAQYFTVYIDQEEMGRLYAGDWAFFPWSATAGTKETFVTTIGGTWVVGDEFHFDGVEVKAATTTVASIATQIDEQEFPNWTTTRSTNAVTFTARDSRDDGTVVIVTADMELIQSSTGATAVVSSAALCTATSSDIIVVPSVVTTMDLEHILLNE